MGVHIADLAYLYYANYWYNRESKTVHRVSERYPVTSLASTIITTWLSTMYLWCIDTRVLKHSLVWLWAPRPFDILCLCTCTPEWIHMNLWIIDGELIEMFTLWSCLLPVKGRFSDSVLTMHNWSWWRCAAKASAPYCTCSYGFVFEPTVRNAGILITTCGLCSLPSKQRDHFKRITVAKKCYISAT